MPLLLKYLHLHPFWISSENRSKKAYHCCLSMSSKRACRAARIAFSERWVGHFLDHLWYHSLHMIRYEYFLKKVGTIFDYSRTDQSDRYIHRNSFPGAIVSHGPCAGAQHGTEPEQRADCAHDHATG